MKRLTEGPSSMVTSWQAYDINGYTFYTIEKDTKSRVVQNSGVLYEAIDDNGAKTTYFGFIEHLGTKLGGRGTM